MEGHGGGEARGEDEVPRTPETPLFLKLLEDFVRLVQSQDGLEGDLGLSNLEEILLPVPDPIRVPL